jgi:hypothetical protein
VTQVATTHGLLTCAPDDVLVGRCYDSFRERDGLVFEGVGRIVAGPVVFSSYEEPGARAGVVRYVGCETCSAEHELTFIDKDVARQHALTWALGHRCPENEDVR